MTEILLFTLNAPTSLKDEIVDRLISLPNLTGFNLNKMNGYSKEHSLFDIAEQVEGYRTFYQFEVLIASNELNMLKECLNPVCQPAKLRYWLTPVIESGHF
ncbi:MAG: hypothetical protein COB45_00525 [Gammaproteobacteria bacterium]|nr:MAG: hypothetical protein COB45_00525 [Gammaproteobacteria bacterium]PHR84744.1 MAG: hypothetical protein COA59_05065 [Colwellia sp.]